MRSAAAYNADMYGIASSAKVAWSAMALRVPVSIGRLRSSGVEHEDLAAVAGDPHAVRRRLERDPDRDSTARRRSAATLMSDARSFVTVFDR